MRTAKRILLLGPLGGASPWLPNFNRLKAMAQTQKGVNTVHQASAMASPPTITVSASQPSGLTSAFVWTTNPFPFVYYGGTPQLVSGVFQFFASATLFSSGGNIGAGLNQNYFRVGAVCNAAKVGIHVRQTAAANYRFIVCSVDGSGNLSSPQYVSFAGTQANIAGGDNFVQLDFTSVGGKALRAIFVEGTLNCGIIGFNVAPGDTVTAPVTGFGASNSLFRISTFGDSFTAGTGPAFESDGFFIQASEQLGATAIVASGVGGSGFVATGSGTVYNFGQRLSDVTTLGPSDAAFVCFGENDNGTASATITAAALADLQYMRAHEPLAPIFVVGEPDSGAPVAPGAPYLACVAAIKAAQQQVPGTWFIDLTGVTYTKSDATHPDGPGSITLASYLIAQMQTILGVV